MCHSAEFTVTNPILSPLPLLGFRGIRICPNAIPHSRNNSELSSVSPGSTTIWNIKLVLRENRPYLE